MTRTAVLMSGGVDSSVAALLLARAGHEVIGVTARMWRDASRCCGDDDVYRSERVCHKLGARHVVLDVTARFDQQVVGYFRSSYLAGLTPNPCAVCNRDIKFGALVDAALKLGCEQVASGHYARLARVGEDTALAEPADRRKSQVYFLALVPGQVLARLVFPLENLLKRDVVELARDAGLPMRPTESQDLCFVASGKHRDFLEESPAAPGPGKVLDTGGRVVGEHRGHYAYTVGQRFGLAGRRLYVISKNAAANEVVIGERARALARRIRAGSVNFFLESEARPGSVVSVKYRYNSPPAAARVTGVAGGCLEVLLDEPCFAPAPGQVLACYRDDHLVCAGVIEWAGDRGDFGEAG
jgi:tRNA-specific 2-thiouridylase